MWEEFLMNKVFKVIWSEARNAYVVVSEIAKNHGSKSCSTKKLLAMLIATGVMTCASVAPAMATNPAPDDKNVTIGKGAVSAPYDKQTGNVAIGENAKAWNGTGRQEAYVDFGQGGIKGGLFGATVKDGTKLPGSIAIGKNTVARSGSTMIGDHGYTGKIGDITIAPDGNGIMKYNNDVYSTTIGANSFNSGALASVTGAFSIASSKYDGSGGFNSFYAVQNTGATVYGSLNSIESATSNSYSSGIASSVLGFANRTQNANAALIWGTGNEVTNSVEDIGIDTNWNNVSVAEAQQKAIKAMQSNQYAGGSVMAIGGGNKADYAKYSQLTGVQNKVTGTEAKAAKYDFVNGYQNTVTEASDVTVIGIKNEVTADGNKVIGDNHKVSGKDNVIFGSADQLTETTVNNAVVLGHNAQVTGEGGVALGAGSVADRVAGVVGYDPATGAAYDIENGDAPDYVWKATSGAVSVGSDRETRQITNVAAGSEDTDAVNVAQLKKVNEEALKHSTVTKGANITVTEGLNKDGGKEYNVALNNDIHLFGDNDAMVSISGSKGTIWASGGVTAGSVAVGTAKADGTTPFFVNSNGAFYGANNNFSVDKDGKVTATAGEIGNVVLQNGVFTGHSALRDGELFVGDASGNYSQITTKGAKLGKVTVAVDGKISGVAAGAVTADSTDAVNGSQLHAVATEAGKHSKVVNGNNINVEETDVDGQKFYKVNLNKDIMLGDLTGKYVNISGTNGTIETTGYIATKDRVYADKGAKLADIDVTGNKISNGASSIVLDGSNVKVNDKVTIDQNGKISGVAAGEISSTSTDAINGSQLKETNDRVTKNEQDIAQNKADIAALDNRVTQNEADIAANRADIDKNKADIAANRTDIDKNAADIAQNKTDIKNLDNRVTNVEELAKKHTTVTQGDNITVTEGLNADGGKEYNVALNKDINLDSVTTGQTVMNNDGLKVGKDVSVTATAVTAGKTSISDEGVKVGDKTYISDKGLNANDQKVTNVAAGELSATSKDAVNGSQLYATNQEVANNTNRINKLGSRVNKVGAGAAALAALHPMDFDPDDKLTFSAGYGNYAGENAAAIGAYYRPDEKVMFSVAGTVGNGENMVNAGVSFALDRTNHVSNSRTALAREVIDLRGQLAVMGAKMAKMEKAFGMLDETKTKLFPDVPANHWAYEYIAKLAGNGYIEGYPDGNFGGDRLMTRYEFAAMLYRAIENGAALEEKIIKEFEPELGRIRVDRISGEDGDRDKIERVRVNDTKGERDHYGNKLAK